VGFLASGEDDEVDEIVDGGGQTFCIVKKKWGVEGMGDDTRGGKEWYLKRLSLEAAVGGKNQTLLGLELGRSSLKNGDRTWGSGDCERRG